jgi:hypothetical protein
MDPLVGERPWFGPRRLGWGLSPVSIEGWVVTGLALAAAGAATRRWPDRPAMRQLPVIVLLFVILLKGTAPGGPRARSAWIEEKSRRAATSAGGD